jgi:tRNA(adenine34) deaminase
MDTPEWSELDIAMMSAALGLARCALDAGEVPVGAVLVSAKGADARHQTMEKLASSSGGALDTAPVLREFLKAGGGIVGQGFNRPISSSDPTAHAEIEALREAASRRSNYRLLGTTLYVTLEPCVMCAGAIVAARVQRLVFGARDIRFGAIRSKFQLADSDLLNHRVDIREGLLAAEAGALLSSFFARRRTPLQD